MGSVVDKLESRKACGTQTIIAVSASWKFMAKSSIHKRWPVGSGQLCSLVLWDCQAWENAIHLHG